MGKSIKIFSVVTAALYMALITAVYAGAGFEYSPAETSPACCCKGDSPAHCCSTAERSCGCCLEEAPEFPFDNRLEHLSAGSEPNDTRDYGIITLVISDRFHPPGVYRTTETVNIFHILPLAGDGHGNGQSGRGPPFGSTHS